MSNKNSTILMPKLRFKEPNGKSYPDWSVKNLKELAELFAQKNRDGNIHRVLTNSASAGIVDQRDYFDKDIADKNKLEGYYVVEKGDYVYNPRTSNIAPVGPISKNKIGIGVMSPLYTVFRFKSPDNDFFEQYFKTSHWHSYLRSASNTGARHDRMSITPTVFMEMQVPFPHLSEQQKIADCLSSLDDLITAENEKLEALKAHKKGLMQQLFPAEGETVPKLRFKGFDGEWEEKRLDKACVVNPYVGNLPDSFIYIDLESVERGRLLKKNLITIDTAPSRAQRLLRPKDVIFQMVRPYQQNNYFFQPEDNSDYVASTGYAQLRANESCEFLYHYLHSPEFVERVLEKCTGSNYPAINSGELSAIKVVMPNPIEQQKIADCLSSLDESITTQAEKIENLKLHKRGLMQQLFPSLSEP